jgi:hypothetical protein
MMRVLPSLLAVEAMRRGAEPREAAREVKSMVAVQYSIATLPPFGPIEG